MMKESESGIRHCESVILLATKCIDSAFTKMCSKEVMEQEKVKFHEAFEDFHNKCKMADDNVSQSKP